MSTGGRGRQQPSLRSRLLSWPGSPAPPPRGPSQRQPSRVTTTATTSSAPPQPPGSAADGQPSSPQAPPRPKPALPPSGAPSRSSSSSSSAEPVPQMGPAPSRPASDARPPRAPPGPAAQTAARAPPLTSPPSDGPPLPQPLRRMPSRQVSRPHTQPPSPPGQPSQTQAAALPSPSPSPAPPAITTEPKAPSPTPSPALSTSTSPPSPKEIPEVPTPAPRALQPDAAATKQLGREEETTASPGAKLQPRETSPEEEQTAIDPASMRSEVARQPPTDEAGEKHISTATQTARHPSPEEAQRDTTGGRLPPREDELRQKQTIDSSQPPKPEAEQEEQEEKIVEAEPEAKEEEKLVIGPEASQKSTVDGTDQREKRTVSQAELNQERDTNRPRNTDVNPEEDVKKETPNSCPLPTPAQNPQIGGTHETHPAPPLERTQIKNSRVAAEAAEKAKQATEEPQQPQPTHVHLQRTREEKPSVAQPAREKQTPVPEKEPPAGAAKGKEGKIAISTVARASASSGEEQSGGLHKEIKEGISKLVQSLAVQHTKQTVGGHGISIITLAGDNHGATMYVGGHGTPSRDGKKNVFVHKGPSADDGGGATAPGEDGGQKKTEQRRMPTTETNANVNSNVQAVNNSILHDSCCSEESPGVHLVLSSKPTELAPAQKEAATPAELQRPRTRPPLLPKVAQEPTVRRRCLRAMFLESSDDDPENPQKPRRHGCRFSCDDGKGGKGGQDGTAKG